MNSPEGITAHLCELVDYFWKEYGIRFIPTLDGERSEAKTRSPGKQMTGKDKRISQLLNAARVYHVASTAEADHALPAPFIDAAIRTHFGLPEDAPGAIFTKDSDIFSNGAFDIGVSRDAGFLLCIKPRPGSSLGTFDLLVDQADEYKRHFAASEEKSTVVEVIPKRGIYIEKLPWVVEHLPSPDGGDIVLYSKDERFEGLKLVNGCRTSLI